MSEHWKYYPQFSESEMACKCGCGMLPPEEFMDWFYALRMKWGKPIHVVSGARCPRHNNAVSSSGFNGPHTIGAVDIRIAGEELFNIIVLALEHGATGIGYNQRLTKPLSKRVLHLDPIRKGEYPHIPRPWMWSY